MPDLFIYLIKVNVALLIFCLGYYAVLRHLTFYNLNRVYLVTAIIFSTLYPKVNLSDFLNRHEDIARPIQVVIINWQEPIKKVTTFLGHDVWYWLQAAFWLGVMIFAIRLCIQLISLYRLHKQSEPVQLRHYMIRVIAGNINPFSFWRSIYINPENHSATELDAILEHEQIHVNELHTLDILLAEISAIFYWFNPGIWLMKRAIRENIEFITDRKILQKGVDSKAYQYSLLSVNFGAQSNAIVNHFNISTIKKRIIMMNAKRSSSVNITRYLFLVPVVMVLLLVFSVSKAEISKTMHKSGAHMLKVINNVITKIDLISDKKEKPVVAKTTPIHVTEPTELRVFQTFSIRTDTLPAGKVAADTGKHFTIRLRGSAAGDKQPDVYVDGVKTAGDINELNKVDPNIIYSIDVRKDLASAPNGAIYITTKGHEGKGGGGHFYIDTIRNGKGGNSSLKEITVVGHPSKIMNIKVMDSTNVIVTGYSRKAVTGIKVNGGPVRKVFINGDSIFTSDMRVSTLQKAAVLVNGLPGADLKDVIIMRDTTMQGRPTKIRLNGRLISSTGPASSINFADKLIIIDGKQASQSDMKKLSADKIQSVNNLGEAAATEKYGDKGKNGAVIITTKKKL
jgi:bla regulator protein BlaR1